MRENFFTKKNPYPILISEFPFYLSRALYNKGKLFVAGSNLGNQDSPITVIDLDSNEQITVFSGHKKNIHSLLLLDEFTLVSADYSGEVRAWNLKTHECIFNIKAHNQCVSSLLKYDDNFLTASYDGTIKRWNCTGELLNIYEGHHNYVFSLVKIGVNQFASLSGNSDKRILLWNIDFNNPITEIDITEAKDPHLLTFFSNSILATVGGQVCVWDIEQKNIIRKIQQPFYNLGTSSLCKINNELLAIGSDQAIFILDISSAEIVDEIICHSGFITDILLMDNGKLLSFGDDGKIFSHQLPIKEAINDFQLGTSFN